MIGTIEKHGLNPSRQEQNLEPAASQRYFRLLVERYAEGLLEPFSCSRCKIAGLDPVGRQGKGEWLCANCADPEGGQNG